MSYSRFCPPKLKLRWINDLKNFLSNCPPKLKLGRAMWARMDSNHRTPKRTDLQSVAVGHLATCPFSTEPLVGIEPTTYWLQISCSTSWAKVADFNPPFHGWINPLCTSFPAGQAIKNYPQNFGKAKVREFNNCKNFDSGIFYLFSSSWRRSRHKNTKAPESGAFVGIRLPVFLSSFLSD